MAKKKTNEEFIQEIKNISPNIEILGEYSDSQTKIKIKCKIDGYEWFSKPSNLLQGKGCPKCANVIKRTHEEFIEIMKNIHPNIEVVSEYINCDTKIKLRCKIDNYEWETTPNSLLSAKTGCKMCSIEKKKENAKIKFINKVNRLYPNILVLDEYIDSKTPIRFKCKLDDYTWSDTPRNLFEKQVGCTKCYLSKKSNKSTRIYASINDIITIDSEFASLLENIKDGYDLGITSNKKVNWKCPECGNIVYQSPANIKRNNNKLCCPMCSDGISYPNKLMYNLLKQININFETEKVFKWCKFLYKEKQRIGIYDFYFELNNKKYIIEMDGLFHYKTNNISGQTKEESNYIDNIKDKLAYEHNICVIRIDSKKSELEYIKNNILSSRLLDLFDFNKVNWLKCHELSLSSNVKIVWDIWNSGVKNVTDIVNITKFNPATIRKYLKNGTKLGICDYSVERARKNAINKSIANRNNKKSVICTTTYEIFDSISNACKKYKLGGSNVIKCCRKERNYSGKLSDGTKLEWMYYDDYIILNKELFESNCENPVAFSMQ